MADPRFFSVAGPFTAAELARRTGATLTGDGEIALKDVAPLDIAGPDQLSFLDNRKYLEALRRTRAGACFIHPDLAKEAPKGTSLLITPGPYRAYALAAQAFYPEPHPEPGIDPTAVIEKSAKLGPGCRIEAGAVIGARAELGAHCHIGPNAVIGPACVLGDEVRVGANASLSYCLIGSRVRLFPGVCIGQEGFGFAPDRQGFVKVPQLGRVIIGDDVEVGANSTLDRGSGPDTVIGPGTMIDNLVQIGHNVQIGRQCALAAQVGIAGSTKLGDFVMIGGQAGVSGHLTIGSGVQIAAKSGVIRDIESGHKVMGYPALPLIDHHRLVAILQRMIRKQDKQDK